MRTRFWFKPSKISLALCLVGLGAAVAYSVTPTSLPLTDSGPTASQTQSNQGAQKGRSQIPTRLPEVSDDGYYYIETPSGRRRLTIIPSLQKRLSSYIADRGNHLMGIMVAESRTGRILAMTQGKDPKSWGQNTHTALYPGFPAASIFKNVTTAAAFDVLSFDKDKNLGLVGGCADVHSRGVWLNEPKKKNRHAHMSLGKAFGRSCNGFYAKMAVDEIGLGTLKSYAKKFGWGEQVPADFFVPPSPIIAPKAEESSIHTVGRFAAGFGLVGLSAAHATWFTVAIANDGIPKKLRIFDQPLPGEAVNESEPPIMSLWAAKQMRAVMKRTTHGGTATSVFRKRRYRKIRGKAGGKTGTLTGKVPKGLTNWFVGIMPLDQPEIVVSAVSVTGNLWIIKAPHLAAEAFLAWDKLERERKKLEKKKKNLSPLRISKDLSQPRPKKN